MGQKSFGNIPGADFYNSGTLHIIEEHLHSICHTTPYLADPFLVSTTASAWNEFYASTMVEVWSAAGAPTEPFDVHWAVISDISAIGDYHMAIFSGESGSEVKLSCFPFSKSAGFVGEGNQPIQMPRVAAGTRLSVGLSSGNNAINSCKFKLLYHTY